jgi:acetate kinase
MGTRCGQLDPGVMLYLMDQGMDVAALSDLLYRESGLKGLSGRTGDMRALLQAEADDPRAAQAVAYFVAHVRREMGALVAEMGGVDALVFTAGVGENAAAIRERVCDGLAWLGMRLDHAANDAVACAAEIGAPDSRIRVLVIPTDEEKVIACAAAAAIRASD